MSGVQLFSKMFGLVSVERERLNLHAANSHSQGRKSKDIITLFHKPSSQASIRVHNMLKQTAATASATATEDQASDHSAQDKVQRDDFALEVVETPPTSDQLQTMLSYAGGKKADALVTGATSPSDALKKLKESGDLFKRPVVCARTCLLLKSCTTD